MRLYFRKCKFTKQHADKTNHGYDKFAITLARTFVKFSGVAKTTTDINELEVQTKMDLRMDGRMDGWKGGWMIYNMASHPRFQN